MRLDLPPNKTFSKDLTDILSCLENSENFAFSRFSDGEVYMLQNKEIILHSNGAKVGDIILPGNYPEDDLKHFDPSQHSFYRQKLEDSIKHRQHNFFKGLSCRCCIADGEKNFQWQLDLIGPGDEHSLTWANLFINCNYLEFLSRFFKIIKEKKIVFVLNKNGCDYVMSDRFEIDVIKTFPIGPNCIVNNYSVIDDIKSYIRNNNISDHVFLCAASSLSNMVIHQVYSEFPNNTYVDVGSSLNPFIEGIKSRRSYMGQLHTQTVEGNPCVW